MVNLRIKTLVAFFGSFFIEQAVLAAPAVNVSVEPVALLVREICSDQCDVFSLVPKGASEHSWQPGPKDVIRAKQAVASIAIGLGFDDVWFKKIGVMPKTVLKLGEQLSPMTWWSDDMSGDHKDSGHSKTHGKKDSHTSKDHDHDDDHDHDHAGQDDPHVWTDAGRMSKAAELISAHLALHLPSGAAGFKDRSRLIAERLTKLQLDTDTRRKNWKTRPVVMFHDTAGYFARRFNLPVLSVSAGASGHNHSAKMIANVARRFKEVSVAAIMVEKDDGAAKNLARELKTTVKVVDFAASRPYQRWDDWYLHLVTAWEDVLK